MQQHDGIQRERVQLPTMLDGPAQKSAGRFAGEDRRSALGDEGEEERATGLDRPTIIGHDLNVNRLDSPVNERWASTPTLPDFSGDVE